MVGSNLKADAMALMDKRAAMESQIEAIIARLNAPGGPGVKGSLVDKDGFPRADLDIPAIRGDRQRLAVLHNDHKEVTQKIERIILELHSSPQQTQSTSLPSTRTGIVEPTVASMDVSEASTSIPINLPVSDAQPMEEDRPISSSYLRPYAVIDELTAGSPAEADGIQIGDLVLKFGPVIAGTDCIRSVSQHLQQSQGRKVDVRVLREGREVLLEVTPRPWSGRGLLGCHLQPFRT